MNDGIPYGEVELRAVITTVLLVACLCMGSAAYPGEARVTGSDAADVPALQIDFEHGLLSVAAHRVPWKNVLDRITEKTGIRFRSANDGGDSAEEPRSPSFDSLFDVSEGLDEGGAMDPCLVMRHYGRHNTTFVSLL